MKAFMEMIRFADGFNFWGVLIRLVVAVLCGGLIGLEREYHRRPAGFRTHILVCLGASMTVMTSQYLILEAGLYTDPARLGAQVIAGIGFIGAGTIIVTRRRQVKGLTTAAGLWASAILGLAAGSGFVEAALIGTAVILIIELLLSRVEFYITATAHDVNLYIEYRENDSLSGMTDFLREHHVTVNDLQITKSSKGEGNPCAIFTLLLPRTISHDKLMTGLSEISGVVSVEEL